MAQKETRVVVDRSVSWHETNDLSATICKVTRKAALYFANQSEQLIYVITATCIEIEMLNILNTILCTEFCAVS